MFAERVVNSPRVVAIGTRLRHSWYQWLFVIVLGWLALYPLFMLLLTSVRAEDSATFTLDAYARAFSEASTYRLMWTTTWLAVARTLVALVIGVCLAWLVTRTDIPWRGPIEMTIWLTFFLPGIPVILGWVLLGSRTGLLNTWARNLPFVDGPIFNIYSYWGIIFVAGLHTAAFIFLLTAPVFRSMDTTLEESSRASGASQFRTLMHVTLPLALPAILEATFYIFVFALESFETELILGTPARIYVFSTQVYLLAEAFPTDLPKATALSSVFLAIVVGLVILRMRMLRGKHYTTITGKGYRPLRIELGPWRWAALAFAVLYLVLATVGPLAILVIGSFIKVVGVWGTDMFTLNNWRATLSDPRLVRAIFNTFQLGILVGLGATTIAAMATYLMVRTKFAGRRTLEFITWAPRMAPASVLAIAFIQAYVGGTTIFRPILGTVLMLAVVLTVNFMPLGTRTMSGAMGQVSYELEEASRIAGGSWIRTFRLVMVPLLMPALITAFVISFLLATRNLVLVIFFYTSQSRVLSTMLWEEWTGSYTGRALALGLLMVLMAGVALGVALLLRKRLALSLTIR